MARAVSLDLISPPALACLPLSARGLWLTLVCATETGALTADQIAMATAGDHPALDALQKAGLVTSAGANFFLPLLVRKADLTSKRRGAAKKRWDKAENAKPLKNNEIENSGPILHMDLHMQKHVQMHDKPETEAISTVCENGQSGTIDATRAGAEVCYNIYNYTNAEPPGKNPDLYKDPEVFPPSFSESVPNAIDMPAASVRGVCGPARKPDDLEKKRIWGVAERCLDLMGAAGDPRYIGIHTPVSGWLAAGADPDLDIYPTVTRIMTSRRGVLPDGLGYFTKAILRAVEARKAQGEGNYHAAYQNGSGGQKYGLRGQDAIDATLRALEKLRQEGG